MSQQGADLIGRTLGRTYQVERLLGGGGMGAVYAARHVRTGGLFAVKILHRETAADTDIYKRFQDEARTVSALRHPHIVQVTDFDQDDDGTPFIVMELLEGEDLYQRLCRVGKLAVEQVLDIGRQVGSALHAAHEKGIIHRDIKPQNIFLVRHEVADLVTEVAKVVDFGISKIRRTGQQMTRDMTILGTPQFMSPEAALGQNSQLDGRADQWSLAVIMYLALTGRLPFDGDNLVGVLYMVVHEQPVRLKQLAPDVPEPMRIAIERAMAKKKEDRYPRMVDFVRAMTGLGVTGAASVRLGAVGMSSAVGSGGPPDAVGNATQFVVPSGPPAASAVAGNATHFVVPSAPSAPSASAVAEARTAVPHLLANTPAAPPRAQTPPQQRSPAVPRNPTPPQQQTHFSSDAPTKAPHLAAPQPEELPPTRLGIPPIDKEITPLTVPIGQAPEMVATPTSPTAFSPLGIVPVAARPAAGQPRPSGETPTNIALTDSELQSLLSGSSSTPEPEAVEELQGVPTRVAVMPSSEDRTVARYELPTAATVPLSVVHRPYTADNPFDPNYPSTLSHATGQEVSLRPRLLPQWSTVREVVLKLVGVVPRSSVRLAVTGGVLTLLFALTVLWLVGSGPASGDGKVPGEGAAAAGGVGSDAGTPGPLADAGTGGLAPRAGAEDKNGGKPAPGKPAKPVVKKPPLGKSATELKRRP